jgi:hypothetical protein
MAQEATSPAKDDSQEIQSMYEEIAALAHALWEERGCPEGSPDEDWFRAEEQLKGKR